MKKEKILILTIATIFLSGCGNKQKPKEINEYFYLTKKEEVKVNLKEYEEKKDEEFKEKEKEKENIKTIKNDEKNNEKIKDDINEDNSKNDEKNNEKTIEKIKDDNVDKNENIENFEYFVIVLKNDKKEKIKISKNFYITNFKNLTNEELKNKFLKDKESEEEYKIIKILKEKNEL